MKAPQLIVVLTAVALTLIAFYMLSLSHIARTNCEQVQAINGQIETTLHRSAKTIPTISYYRTHPGEKAKALKQVHQEIKDFQPQSCTAYYWPW